MRLLSRFRSLDRLGEAVTRVAERSAIRRLTVEDEERDARLGDIEGQTARAFAFADQLEGVNMVQVVDPATVTPHGWSR